MVFLALYILAYLYHPVIMPWIFPTYVSIPRLTLLIIPHGIYFSVTLAYVDLFTSEATSNPSS